MYYCVHKGQSIGPYPESDEYASHYHIVCKIHFNQLKSKAFSFPVDSSNRETFFCISAVVVMLLLRAVELLLMMAQNAGSKKMASYEPR
jgi:hypothetical protein